MENSDCRCQLHVLEAGFSGRRCVSTPRISSEPFPVPALPAGLQAGAVAPALPLLLLCQPQVTTPPRPGIGGNTASTYLRPPPRFTALRAQVWREKIVNGAQPHFHY